MRLRICDGERERTAPASLDLVEEAFTLLPIGDGYEIAVADGERWIAAIAVQNRPAEEVEFLLSGVDGDATPPSGRVSRSEALKRFRDFIQVAV
jgi:hypothetical protein